jgi:hypothetical protein
MPRRLVRGAGLLGENRLDAGGVAENWAVQIRSAPTRETGQPGGGGGGLRTLFGFDGWRFDALTSPPRWLT